VSSLPVPLRIRPMHAKDIDAVMVLEYASFPEPWPRSLYEREIKNDRYSRYLIVEPVTAADAPSSLLAQGGYWLMGEEAHIVTIAVDPVWRGHRLGKWILLTLMAEARQRGAQIVTLEVRPSNHPARALYARVGFIQSGERKRYYPNGEDALILELTELDQPAVWRPLAQELEQLTLSMTQGIVT
jgi:[ribosomal protein S18]-alanine N-acetyltransferase